MLNERNNVSRNDLASFILSHSGAQKCLNDI